MSESWAGIGGINPPAATPLPCALLRAPSGLAAWAGNRRINPPAATPQPFALLRAPVGLAAWAGNRRLNPPAATSQPYALLRAPLGLAAWAGIGGMNPPAATSQRCALLRAPLGLAGDGFWSASGSRRTLHILLALLVAVLLLVFTASSASAKGLVVLDPGHGGAHSGTKSDAGVLEKTVTLSIAHFTKRHLATRGIKAILTRSADRTMLIRDRVQFAHSQGGDCLVSIHANHAPIHSRRGSETYVLAVEATSPDIASFVAAEERGEGDERNFGGQAQKDHTARIVADLRKSAAHQMSARLALHIQNQLGLLPALKPNRGLRQAPFLLLKAAVIPAVLVEVAYLSNPQQAAFVQTKQGQDLTGQALARGIVAFLKR